VDTAALPPADASLEGGPPLEDGAPYALGGRAALVVAAVPAPAA
jgi:hypothetical protein